MRRVLFVGIATLGLGLATQPALQAQGSVDLSSSMGAYCLGGSCSNVMFNLNVIGNTTLDVVRLFSDPVDPGAATPTYLWKFGTLLGVYDSGGNDVLGAGWAGSIDAGQVSLYTNAGAGYSATEPLSIKVAMAQWSDPSNFPYMRYEANGHDADGKFFSTAGTVTPEPSTWVLLATGLIGLFGFARKRKGTAEVQPDAAVC